MGHVITSARRTMKWWRSVNHLAQCVLAISLLWSASAIATENFAGFRHIDTSGEPSPAPDWGPVPTDKASVANLSPVLLPFFNNGPVFGLPGTVVGDFWQNTQLTGDWGGFRTSLAEHGIFFDLVDLSAAPRVDLQSAHTLVAMANELTAKGIRFQAVEPRSSVRDRLRHEGIDSKLGGVDRFTTVADVIDHFLSANNAPLAA
jgi:hypothetical protein